MGMTRIRHKFVVPHQLSALAAVRRIPESLKVHSMKPITPRLLSFCQGSGTFVFIHWSKERSVRGLEVVLHEFWRVLQVLNKSARLVCGKFFRTEGLAGFQLSQRNLQRS